MATSIKFYIKITKRVKEKQSYPIYLRVVHNRQKSEGRISATLIPKCDIDHWSVDHQRFNSKQKHLVAHNILLNEIQNEFHNFLRLHISGMSTKSPQEITNHLLSRHKETFESVTDVITAYYENVIFPDVDKAPGTKKNYKKSINYLRNYLLFNKHGKLGIKDFSHFHASKFIDYLKTPDPEHDKIGLNNQTVNSIIKNIKPIFKKLLFENRISVNPFEGLTVSFKKTIKPRLSNDQFNAIVALDLSQNPPLVVYRDIFLFLCYTGLSFCDAIDLRDVILDKGMIELNRKKSNVGTRQFLTLQSLQIIKTYFKQIPEQRILPKRSLDKTNLNLKLIAVKACIDFPLTTYTARRFFRQSIYEAGVVEGLVVKSLMGHTNNNDIDSHYFNVSESVLLEAKVRLESHFKNILK